MPYFLKYRHPVNGNEFYFVDLHDEGDLLRPIGCMSYRRHQGATVFHSMDDAVNVVKYLFSLGYDAKIINVH